MNPTLNGKPLAWVLPLRQVKQGEGRVTDANSVRQGSTWRSLILYLLVTPAALQLLARLDEHFEFSGLIGRLVRAWSELIHGVWAGLVASLQELIGWHPSANQIDALTWIVLMVGAAGSSAALGAPKQMQDASPMQAAVLFWLAFLVVAGIFLEPYVPTVIYYLNAAIADAGLVRTIAAAAFAIAVVAVSASHLVKTLRRARQSQAASPNLTPFWTDVESLIAPFLVGPVVGVILALPIMENAEAVDRAAAQSQEPAPGISLLLPQNSLAPVVLMCAFTLSLLFLRRYNWPTMVRQVATATGILIADQLIRLWTGQGS